eukprot:202039-Pyramimonas_sp.AAC.1
MPAAVRRPLADDPRERRAEIGGGFLWPYSCGPVGAQGVWRPPVAPTGFGGALGWLPASLSHPFPLRRVWHRGGRGPGAQSLPSRALRLRGSRL